MDMFKLQRTKTGSYVLGTLNLRTENFKMPKIRIANFSGHEKPISEKLESEDVVVEKEYRFLPEVFTNSETR